MGSNNAMYKRYKEMQEGYKSGQDGLFEHAVRCWMALNPENPFAEEDPAHEQFFLMKKRFTIWQRGGVDSKINRTRMLEAARKLCELNPKQPYHFDKKEEEHKSAEVKAAEENHFDEENKTEEKKPVKHVLGVIPEENVIQVQPVVTGELDVPDKGFFGHFFKKK